MKRPAHLAPLPPTRTDLHPYIDEVFGASGAFALAFEGYEPRAGQIEFAHAVADAIMDKVALLAEAGTGVGKSYGALIPAVKSVVSDGGKVVYVTANIALQEQLAKTDLPSLERVTGMDFKFAIAKGFSNYVCKKKSDDSDAERIVGKLRLPVVSDLKEFERIYHDGRNLGAFASTGDLSDLPFEPSGFVKSLVTIPSDECYGKGKCDYWLSDCYPRKARKAFADADVVVTNYHLYFLNLDMQRRGLPGILPEHRVVVFDEFHAAAEIARQYLGERVSEGSIRTVVRELDASGPRADRLNLPRGLDPIMKQLVEAQARDFFQELLRLAQNPKAYKARLNKPGMIDGGQLEASLNKTAETYVKKAESPGLDADARDWLRSRASLAARQAGVILGSRELEPDDQIFYIDLQKSLKNFNDVKATLVREPLSPAHTLREHLFEKNAEPRAIVCCSATLTTTSSKAPFGFIAKQTGLQKYDECVAESPFDYAKCAFVVPRGMPDPQDPRFAEEAAEQLRLLTTLTHGRTLGLFTSYRVMEVAARKLQGAPFRVLKQGTAPRMQLIREFKEDQTSVLLGTESFWTGVDVPGDSLVAVFIDKIPFDHFEDPVLDAVKEHDENWFKNYYLPKAVIAFKQGFGRLIRSVNDHGVVVCCDNRITGKGYGKSFLRAVPDAALRTNDMEIVAKYCAIG